MENKLFIPQKLKVGYQKRSDTYTKKLAYIIYYDEKGKLRKEASWEGWRDKKIPAQEFDNKPHSGFVINKDVQRSSEWFGSGRNMIRIYDDRGMEFEITCDNLVFILMTTNCHKRGLEGEFVYAWQGKELILLPTACEEYKTSIKFSALKTEKISKKDLIPGCSYKTKEMIDFIYLGYFECYNINQDYDINSYYKIKKYSCVPVKNHVFINSNNKLLYLNGLTKIACKNTDAPVSNYAELMDILNKSRASSVFSKIELGKLKKVDLLSEDKFEYTWDDEYDIETSCYKKEGESEFIEYKIIRKQKYSEKNNTCKILGFKLQKYAKIYLKENQIVAERLEETLKKVYSKKEIEEMKFNELMVVLTNGTKIKFNDYIDYSDSGIYNEYDDDNYEEEYDDEEDIETEEELVEKEKLKTLQIIY